MKFLLLLLCCCLLPVLPSPAQAPSSYVVLDTYSGVVLIKGNELAKRPVASLTKIATAMVTLDWLERSGVPPSQPIPIPPAALTFAGQNRLGFVAGDTASLRDLLYAAMMESDNIAAFAIADFVGSQLLATGAKGGTPQGAFVVQMNALAAQLGMTKTMFLNPHGLDNLPGRVPVSTAYDMALLAKYAMAKPGFRFYVSQKTRQIAITRFGQTIPYQLQNTNTLIGQDGVDGVKTGQTNKAGGCVILSAEKPPIAWQQGKTFYRIDRRLVIVVLGSADRFGEGLNLLRSGWAAHAQMAGPQPPPPR